MSVSTAFAHFHASPASRQSWSALSRDRTTVVVTMWEDLIVNGVYDVFTHSDLPRWRNTLGNRERIANLKFARDNCNGLFKVIRLVAQDPTRYPRSVLYATPDQRTWILTSLDEQTGQFRVNAIGP